MDAAPAATPRAEVAAGALRMDLARSARSAAAAPNAARTAPADAPLAALHFRVAVAPQQWTWQRHGAAPQPVDAALLRWLAAARDAAAQAPAAEAGGSADDDPAALLLLQDGQPRERLQVTAHGLLWRRAAPGGVVRAWALPAAEAAALRAALDQAAP